MRFNLQFYLQDDPDDESDEDDEFGDDAEDDEDSEGEDDEDGDVETWQVARGPSTGHQGDSAKGRPLLDFAS